MEKRFKLVCIAMGSGSGWPSGHVAIDHYHTWPDRPGGKEMCLNYDTDSPAELISAIDEMIDELVELKSQVPARVAQWQSLFDNAKK